MTTPVDIDWDSPLPTPEDEPSEDSNDGLTFNERKTKMTQKKMKKYLKKMAYIPSKPVKTSEYTNYLSAAKTRSLTDNAKQFKDYMVPKERGERIKRLADREETITLEQLEDIIQKEKSKEKRIENIQKRKHEIYYEMLTKLEQQCRSQYLNMVLTKFADFIAKLATTMHIPQVLLDPYSQMQRGLFCNILCTIDVDPAMQNAIFNNTADASQFDVCHKLSHALLSLIVKALDSASTRKVDDIEAIEVDFKMDDYIKERLMCAAEKKIKNYKREREEKFCN